jgi:hypothetical protein
MLYLDINGKPYGGDRQYRADGTLDPEIPDRHDPSQVWDNTTQQWILPTPPPDWDGLRTALRGSPIFEIAFSTTAQNALGLLFSILVSSEAADSPGRLADFQFAIGAVRSGLATDYSAEQLAKFNAILVAHHFPFQAE